MGIKRGYTRSYPLLACELRRTGKAKHDRDADYVDFPHVKQVLCIRREFTYLKSNKKTQEIVFGITSLSKEKAVPPVFSN